MNKKEIIDFLLEKRGYLKEGAARLAHRLDVDEDVCKEALTQARILVQEENDILTGLVLKSRWQTASGEWRESYRATETTTDSEFKNLKESLLSDLRSVSKVVDSILPKDKEDSAIALEINLPDFHFGKIDGTSIEQQSKLFLESVGEIMGKASVYNIKEIILPIGNDLLNSEGMRLSTTKGTPQEDNSNWKLNFRTAWLALVSAVEFLSKIAPVKVIVVLGNHDFERSFYIGELLSAVYVNNSNVEVVNNGSHRTYLQVGKNLLAYTHGDKIKPQDLPLVMATESPIAFSQTTHRSWRLGHLHKHMIDEYRGIEIEVLPALCGNDDWHVANGYFSPRKAMAYVWDYNGGKVGFIQINK